MTGGEILGGAAVGGAKAAAKALKTGDAERAELAELAKTSPVMNMAADAYARRVAVKQELLLKIFKPLALLVGIREEYFETTFPAELAAKTAHIPEDDTRTPPPSVAIPAMHGLGYSLDEPDLKEMYLNLIAAGTDQRRQQDAHPSFADIIKQLSANEAKILLRVLRISNLPMMEVRVMNESGDGFTIPFSHVTGFVETDTGEFIRRSATALFIDNWIRLGLVTVDYNAWLTDEEHYSWCERHPDFLAAKEEAEEEGRVIFQKGILTPTEFGRRFAKAVTPDPNAITVVDGEAGEPEETSG